ncbi:MAG: aldo/keto reductase [Chitinophagaceae bacterium]
MTAIENISKIGFGTYRVSLENPENVNAFNYAIECGCNLIDTASTYNDAELFVGKYIKETKNAELFIVSKAGYVTADFIKLNGGLIAKLNSELNTDLNLINHCIHPAFLEIQLNNSLRRLGQRYLDVFLIHNPEKYLSGIDCNINIERQVAQSFEFLEKKRKSGLIRFYGISSNVIQLDTYENRALNITVYLNILKKIAGANEGFKFIQFPYNLEESDASSPNINQRSLIELARENRLITLSNRPFSMHTKNLYVRIQDVETVPPACDEHYCNFTFHKLQSLLVSRLEQLDTPIQLSDIGIYCAIAEGWNKFTEPEAVYELFDKEFVEFINVVYDYDIPADIRALINDLREFILKSTDQNIKRNSLEYKAKYYKENDIPDHSLSFNHHACVHYFRSGIDHVLVGMTRRKYVEHLKRLF